MRFSRTASLALATFCTLWLSACADTETARRAAKAGDYVTAQENWERLAELGVPEAQISLGRLYIKGAKGVPAQPARGIALLESAETSGDPRAMIALAEIYEKGGSGVPQNTGKAIRLYEDAYDKGYVRAATALGDLYADIKHPEQAVSWYEKGYAGGYAKSALRLGKLYERGKLIAADPVRALAWYIAAQKNGIPEAEKAISRLESVMDRSKIDEARILVERLP